MFGRRKSPRPKGLGAVDGGEGRGVPLGGADRIPPTGYQSIDEDEIEASDRDRDAEDLLWDDGDAADRRRDPLRR
jgi:hypothetical protein